MGAFLRGLFCGPNGQPSSARMFLAAWLCGFWSTPVTHLTAWQAVAVGLLSWAGGQHVAQALGKTAGDMAKATAESVKAAIARRRAGGKDDGTEPA